MLLYFQVYLILNIGRIVFEPVSGFEPETHGLKAKTTAVRFLCGKPYTLLYLAELHRLICRGRRNRTSVNGTQS